LYYRLNVIHIVVPPLRERPEDIPLLVHYLLHKLNRELHKNIGRVQAHALELLAACNWPGNIRQLENTLRHAVVHNQGDVLTADRVEDAMHETVKAGAQSRSSPVKLLDEVEKEHILNALRFASGNRGRVCKLLGISRPTLQRKIRKYQIRF
jgi:transcriptional regulator with PAS, ATPase and Fis domain